MTATAAPPARDSWKDALAEADTLRGTTPVERWALLGAACRLVFAILERHPDREQILAYQEPVSEEVARHMDALKQAFRSTKDHG